jgi:hypothetical protein
LVKEEKGDIFSYSWNILSRWRNTSVSYRMYVSNAELIVPQHSPFEVETFSKELKNYYYQALKKGQK